MTSAATWSDSRVLPRPPPPTSVRSRALDSNDFAARQLRLAADERPSPAAEGCWGLLPATERGEFLPQRRMHELVHALRARQVAQPHRA
jgi:hypothetical protein